MSQAHGPRCAGRGWPGARALRPHGRLPTGFLPGLAGLVLLVAGCASGASSPTDRTVATGGVILPTTRDVYRFDSFAEMVATADAVIVATVSDARPGPTWPPEAGPYRQWFVGIQIEELLYGSAPSSGVALVTDDLLDQRLERYGRDWWRVGTRSVLFLKRRSEDLYQLLNSHSVYIVAGTDLRPVYDGGLAETIGGWSIDELRAKTAEVAALIAAGMVTPQPMHLPGQAP